MVEEATHEGEDSSKGCRCHRVASGSQSYPEFHGKKIRTRLEGQGAAVERRLSRRRSSSVATTLTRSELRSPSEFK